MGTMTGIEWCDHTWNPWRGCAKPPANADGTGEAPECEFCYAEVGSARNPANLGTWGPDGHGAIGVPAYWDLPRKWAALARRDGLPRPRVFFASYADVFEDRPDLVPHRERAFEIIDQCHGLDFLVLTKRPELVPRLWPGGPEARRPNVWLGTSCGHPSSLWRVDALKAARHLADVLFVSAEPLLAPIDFGSRLSGIHWMIVGGESGPADKARPCDPDWIRGIAMQCHRDRVALFVKQLGSARGRAMCVECGYTGDPADPYERVFCSRCGAGLINLFGGLRDRKGGDPSEWPADLRIRELPAGAAAGVA